MKNMKKAVASVVIIGIFIYVFNFEYFGYFLSLICNSAIECVTGGDEYSNQLAKEMDTLKVSKFISLKVNGKEIDLDNTDFGEDFYNDIIDGMTGGETPAGESGSKTINPNDIRFSQSSVNGAAEIVESMRNNGWVGDPIDVVQMPDGGLTTIDNTRVVAARQAGIDVQANIHAYDDLLPSEYIDRFTTKKGIPTTWGDAITLRIGKQNSEFRNNNPFGAIDMDNIN